LGEGSEFWFTLPLRQLAEFDMAGDTPDPVRRGEVAQAGGDAALSGLRLLVVDDSEINCEIAKCILERHGAIVNLAFDGGAALDWLMAHSDEVDLVLLDIQMPAMDGLEVTRRLRLLAQFARLPIVALMAGAFKSQQEAARATGMTDFVSKPFDVTHMVSLIQRLAHAGKERPAIPWALAVPTHQAATTMP
jgi:CheY-like chemotaxis protein